MKRDFDLVRDILLLVEKLDDGDFGFVSMKDLSTDNLKVVEHLCLLHEAGFIDGEDCSTHQGRDFVVRRLTYEGHDFLDTIRDPEIWKQTKRGAEAAGGFTTELLADLAKGFIKTKIKNATGVEV